MTKAELITYLQNSLQPDDALIVLSSDSEGNKISPLSSDMFEGFFAANTKCSGDLADFNYDSTVPCICLFPLR